MGTGSHSLEPSVLIHPSGHVTHASAVNAPGDAEYVLAGQGVQAVLEFGRVEKRPAGQDKHVFADPTYWPRVQV